ncbi:hypothetical protein D915_004117 [Fasciola hepatica]|uniref:Uncharacterized protein n=1 Tax=Fasciola hepatica TaxID=6192 RepID=A0A4E0RTX4_FASHE|nr:hypothetical protein D915_004117 [Fasciola hepatica]
MGDEDADIKDVVVKSLNETGILPRLQAQLRAAVYLALEKHNYQENIPPANSFLRKICSTEDGLIIVSLVAEFLSYANLESTLEVFKHEAELDRISLVDRPALHSSLHLDDTLTPGATIIKLVNARKYSLQITENHASLRKKDIADNGSSTPSRIPTLANRRASAPSSFQQNADEHIERNGYNEENESDGLKDNDSQPSSDRSVATPIVDQQRNGTHIPDFVDPLQETTPNGPEPSPHSFQRDDLNVTSPAGTRSSVASRIRVKDLQPSPSPREPEYQDDFESPRSVGSSKALSTGSSRTDGSEHRRTTPRSIPEVSVRDDSGEPHSNDRSGSATPASRFGLQSPGPNETLVNRGDSRSNSPSVIRVYTRFKKRSPSLEQDSDVDGEDDEISELVKELEYSGEEDTIDKTIDSDESLCLDHVEDVILSRKPVSPSA